MQQRNLVRKGEGRDFDYSQDHCYVKLTSKSTNGELCMVEDHLKPGFRLARHHHKIMTEVFYVLEGEVDFEFDEEAITLRPGDTLTIPPDVWHAAVCEKGGKMLTVFKNGRFDEYLGRLNEMTDEQFEDSAMMKALSAEFDIYEE